ncbi:MAG: hypothetical protein HYX44_00635 [Aquabacterium sp.]|nr:hypothetical protein [Aquabacterium sp.]
MSVSGSWRWVLAFSLALMLVACSLVQTVYNQAANLAYLQFNRAFHLDDDQADRLKRQLQAYLDWHRRDELPTYVRLMGAAAHDAKGPVTAGLACERRVAIEAALRRALDRGVPMMAELLRTLQPEQLAQLLTYIDERNARFARDYLQSDQSERDEALGRFATKWAEVFYGSLSEAQRQKLVRAVLAGPLSAQDVHAEVRRTQAAFVRIARRAVQERPPQDEIEAALRTLVAQLFDPPTEARQAQLDKWRDAGCRLVATTHDSATPVQRSHASDTLRDWAEDLRILSTQR